MIDLMFEHGCEVRRSQRDAPYARCTSATILRGFHRPSDEPSDYLRRFDEVCVGEVGICRRGVDTPTNPIVQARRSPSSPVVQPENFFCTNTLKDNGSVRLQFPFARGVDAPASRVPPGI